jgi:glutathione S-transferase
MAELTLYAESTWTSPWVFHAMVALEEKGLPYVLEVVPSPIPEPLRGELRARSIFGKVPILVHEEAWISESMAISEYLAEQFPAPKHPRLFPADLVQRARARQVMSAMRTGLFALREDRPTSTIFGKPNPKPMSEKGKADAAELIRIVSALIRPGMKTLFDEWCIADADLALMLMRLVSNSDPMPWYVADYALAQWERPSVREFVSHVPATAP